MIIHNLYDDLFFRVPEHFTKKIIYQTIQAIKFCHQHNVSMTFECLDIMFYGDTYIKNWIVTKEN